MGSPSIRRTLPAPQPGSHREVVSPELPTASQLDLAYDAEELRRREERKQIEAFRRAVRAYGGEDALRAALGEKDTYLSKINEAMAGGGKPIQARWRIPLLKDPRSAMILLAHDSEAAGFEPPVLLRDVSEEEIARAAVEVLAESGQLRDTFRAQIAKRLGVAVERVKL